MTHPQDPITRLRGFGFHLPGSPVPLAPLVDNVPGIRSLSDLGQKFTHVADVDSTELAILAARAVLQQTGVGADSIGLVITAPTLLTPHGFNIPAIAVRARLSLGNAEALNLAQGCVGVLAALPLARYHLNDPTRQTLPKRHGFWLCRRPLPHSGAGCFCVI